MALFIENPFREDFDYSNSDIQDFLPEISEKLNMTINIETEELEDGESIFVVYIYIDDYKEDGYNFTIKSGKGEDEDIINFAILNFIKEESFELYKSVVLNKFIDY